MTRPFDSFVILAGMRTGSNLLQERLAAIPGLVCHGEVFNPSFVDSRGKTDFPPITLAERDADPLALLERMRAAGPGMVGFRLFPGHDRRVLNACLQDRRCAKVVLTRNPIDSHVSLRIAQATGQWRLGRPTDRRQVPVVLDPVGLDEFLEARRGFLDHIRAALQHSGQTAFIMDYSDLGNEAVIAGLVRHLTGAPVAGALPPPRRALVRQNPGRAVDKLANSAEALAILSAVDWFDLARTPLAEPRPAPADLRPVLALGAPVMWLPVPGVAGAGVMRAWLQGLWLEDAQGGQGIVTRPSPAELERWGRRHAGRRLCLCVIEHPLTRALRAYCNDVLTGAAPPDLRARLVADYRHPALANQPDPAVHPEGFAAFLRLLADLNAGQVDAAGLPPGWQAQTAWLDAFASIARPDRLLRCHDLGGALHRITAAEGWRAIGPVAAPEDAAPPAADASILHDQAIVALARRAMAADYAAFGFADLP